MFVRQTLKRMRPWALRPCSTSFTRSLLPASVAPLKRPCFADSRRSFSSDRHRYLDDSLDNNGVKERFDPTKTEEEWKQHTTALLDLARSPIGSLSSGDLLTAEETVRWWTTQRTLQGVTAAFRIFERMAAEVEKSPHLLDTEDMIYWLDGRYPRATHLINAALDAWRIVWEETGETLPPEKVLFSVEQFANATPPVPMNYRTYSIIMNAAVKRGDAGTPIFTERILETMLVNSEVNPALLPDTVAFTTAINAWAVSGRPDAAQRAQELWKDMMSLHEDRVIDAAPNTVMYNTVLDALARTAQRANMERADEILREMMTSPYQDVYPDTVSFRLVIYGWTELGDPVGVDRAYSLLREMLRIYETGSVSLDVDASFFSKLISTLARFDTDYSKAEVIHQHLLDLYKRTQDSRFAPDVYTARAMIIIYSKKDQPGKAEALLESLESEAESSGDVKMMPKRGHYRDVLFAWTRSDDTTAADRAERILVHMIDLATSSMNNDLIPDNRSMNAVLRVWSTSRRIDAAYRAESLLRTMQDLYSKTKYQSYRMGPSSILWVMNAWSRSKVAEAPDRAEALLFEMQRCYEEGEVTLRPDRFHYASVMTAWARSGRYDALDSVQDIFEESVDAFEAGHTMARPDAALYGAAIYACGQIGNGEQAEHYLQRMIMDFTQGNESVKPTTKIFNMVLLSWLRSGDLKAPERALAIFKEMEDSGRGVGPDVRPDKRSRSLLDEIISNSRPRNNGAHYSKQLLGSRDSDSLG